MGVDAHQLVAGEGAHLDLLAVQGVGRQLGGGVALAPSLLGGAGVPSTGDGGAAAAVLDGGNDISIRAGLEAGVCGDIQNGLRYVCAGSLVPVADGVDTVICQRSHQTGTGVEAVNVPCVVHAHHELFAGSCSLFQHGVHALHILGAQNACIIVQEIAIVGGHGVGVKLVVHGGSAHRAGQVAALHVVRVQQHFLQRTGVHQLVQLVIGKGENVCGRLRVSQNGILCAGLRLHADLDGHIALVCILLDESICHLAQHGLILFCTPHSQLDVAPALCGRGSAAGGGSGGSGAVGRTAAGGQHTGSSHGTHGCKEVTTRNQLFHDSVLLHSKSEIIECFLLRCFVAHVRAFFLAIIEYCILQLTSMDRIHGNVE